MTQLYRGMIGSFAQKPGCPASMLAGVESTNLRTALRILALPVALLTLCAILFRFPPSQSSFYPHCPIFTTFHLLCPGCGATRALAALLHGNLTQALQFNALAIALLPAVLVWTTLSWLRSLRRRPLPRLPHAAIYSALALTVIFTVLRNL
jgi:hypothetical protein